MSSGYINIPYEGIPKYQSAVNFPPFDFNGALAIALDTDTLYIFDGTSWIPIATPGAAIAIDALVGDVTATGPGVATATIQPGVVTNSKLAAAPAFTLKGNNTGSSASEQDLTVSQVNSMLGLTNSATSIGSLDGQSPSAKGLTLTSNVLYAQSASNTFPGMVNNTTQSFSGNKNFSGTVGVFTPATTTGSLNVRTQGDALTQGFNLESNDSSHVFSIVQRSGGDIYFWTGSNILLGYSGGYTSIGNIGAQYHLDVNNLDTSTSILSPDPSMTLAIKNSDNTAGNTATLTFADNLVPMASIVGVYDSHTASAQNAHLVFTEMVSGVNTVVATLRSTGLNLLGSITASNFTGSSSGTNTGDVTLAAFGSTPNANAASLSGQVLTLQPASSSFGGGVSTTSQIFAGTKQFNNSIFANGGIDTSSPATLAIGTLNATTINIGNAGATVNIQGTVITENTTTLNVTDPVFTVNTSGAAGSASNSGMQVEENGLITGYVETSSDRNSWIFKAPNTAGVAILTPPTSGTDNVALLNATQTFTNKSISGSTNTITNVSLTTGVTGTLPVANGGTGVTTSTGTGNVVLSNNPVLVTPNLDTPSTLVGTNITGTGASFTAGTSTNATVTQTSTNASFYPTFVSGNTTGTYGLDVGTGLSFNPSTNTLSTSAVVLSAAGAASTPSVSITGAPYTGGTGTTTYPLVYLNSGTAPTTWSTSGTEIGINAPSGFTGNFIDAHVNGGASVFSVDSGGNVRGGQIYGEFQTVNNAGAIVIPSYFVGGASAVAAFQFGGSSSNLFRMAVGNSAGTLSAGNNYSSFLVSQSLMTTAATGTHSWYVNEAVAPLGTITSGGATVTNTATLYVGANAATIGTNNYTLYSAGDITTATNVNSLGGNLTLPTTSSTAGSMTINGVNALQMYGTSNFFAGNAGNFTLTTGSAIDNVGVGSSALVGLTTGADNVAIGYQAGGTGANNLTTGSNNVLIGYQSVLNTSSSGSSVAVGSGAKVASSAVAIGQNSSATGADCVAVGQGTQATGNYSTLLGQGINSGASMCVMIGTNASGASNSVVIGYDAQTYTNATGTTAVGYASNCQGTNGIALGSQAYANNGASCVISAGSAAHTDSASNQLCFGNPTNALSSMYLGNGAVATSSPSAVTIQPTPASGTNTVGANLTILAGNGTGTGGSGSINFQTAPAAGSSSTADTYATVLSLSNTGAVLFSGSAGTTGQVLLSAGTTAAPTWNAPAVLTPLTATAKTANYSLLAADYAIKVDNTSGAFAITMPSPSANPGHSYKIVNIGTGTNVVTISPSASETFGARALAALHLTTVGESYTLQSDGTNWQIMDHFASTLPAAYTPVITGTGSNPTLGTNTTNCYWTRHGATMTIFYALSMTVAGSASGFGTYLWSLPSGFTINTTAQPVSTTAGINCVGFGSDFMASNDGGPRQVQAYNSSNLALYATGSPPAFITSGYIPFAANPLYVQFTATIPIANWEE